MEKKLRCYRSSLVTNGIGIITFAISFSGVYIGKAAGTRFSGNAERLGGVVLILLGLKILLTDLL